MTRRSLRLAAGGSFVLLVGTVLALRGAPLAVRQLTGQVAPVTGACLSPGSENERVCTPLYDGMCDEAAGETWFASLDECLARTEGAVACALPEASQLFGAAIGCMHECDAHNPRWSGECGATWTRPVCMRQPSDQEIVFLETGLAGPDAAGWSPDADCGGKCPRGSVTFTACDPVKGPFRSADGVWEALVTDGYFQPWTLSRDPAEPNAHPAICAPDLRMRQCGIHPSGQPYAFIPDGWPCESSMQCYQGVPSGVDPSAYRPYASICAPAPGGVDRSVCQPDCSGGACKPPAARPPRLPMRMNQRGEIEQVPLDEAVASEMESQEERHMAAGEEMQDGPDEEVVPTEESPQEEAAPVLAEPQTPEGALLAWSVAHPLCSNGKLDAEEECDDGNSKDGDGCSYDCYFERGTCGDGIVEVLLGEQCEPKKHSPLLPYVCTPQCRFLSRSCGDGAVQAGEQCDAGAANANAPGAACRTDCSFARCSDGILDPGEECDDANLLRGDGCSRTCKSEIAGTVVPAKKWSDTGVLGLLRGTTGPAPSASVAAPRIPAGAPVPQSGPAVIALMAAGAAAGVAWMRRRR